MIEVLHTGEVGTGALQGTVQGMPKGIVDLSNVRPAGTGLKFVMTVAGLLCLLLAYSVIELLLTKEASVGMMVGRILLVTFAAAAIVTVVIQLMRLRRRFPKTLAMKEFFQ